MALFGFIEQIRGRTEEQMKVDGEIDVQARVRQRQSRTCVPRLGSVNRPVRPDGTYHATLPRRRVPPANVTSRSDRLTIAEGDTLRERAHRFANGIRSSSIVIVNISAVSIR